MMIPAATTPDTWAYLLAGYAVFLAGLALYLVSLIARFRHLRREEDWLDELETERSRVSRGG